MAISEEQLATLITNGNVKMHVEFQKLGAVSREQPDFNGPPFTGAAGIESREGQRPVVHISKIPEPATIATPDDIAAAVHAIGDDNPELSGASSGIIQSNSPTIRLYGSQAQSFLDFCEDFGIQPEVRAPSIPR